MPLQNVFSLTPRESYLHSGAGHNAYIGMLGVSHFPKTLYTRESFDQQHASDELFFPNFSAVDAAVDYTDYRELIRAPMVVLDYDLSDFTPHKEVVLTFRFDCCK